MPEKDYIDFLNSIEFVDEEGVIVPAVLVDDPTPDPEGDAIMEEETK